MLTNKGISFSYFKDKVTWIWPWKRRGYIFQSITFPHGFNSIKEYWHKQGVLDTTISLNKIYAFNQEDMVECFIQHICPDKTVVILIGQKIIKRVRSNMEKRSPILSNADLEKLSQIESHNSLILNVNSTEQASSLINDLSREDGLAMLVSRGVVVRTNDYLPKKRGI